MPAVDASFAQQPMDPNMQAQQQMPAEIPAEPEQEPEMAEEGDFDDSTMALISQLEPKDRETVRAYIISMLDGNSNEEQVAANQPEQQQQVPQVAEEKKVRFTKKQMDELFGHDREPKKDEPEEVLDKHKDNKVSPWATPNLEK